MHNQLEDVTSYNQSFLSPEEADKLFDHLMEYQKLTSMMEIKVPSGEMVKFEFGKMMFLDQDLIENHAFPQSTWGNNTEWSEDMLSIKKRVESYVGHEFKTCVCIYYPDGNSGVDYHSDKRAFGDTSILPSMSLGEERQLNLRENNSGKVSSLVLKHGSLFIMEKGCQEHFEHSLPMNAKYKNPRINLTFRKYGD